jgi:hypothetical protein
MTVVLTSEFSSLNRPVLWTEPAPNCSISSFLTCLFFSSHFRKTGHLVLRC